jgi:type IV secretion system protein VirB1
VSALSAALIAQLTMTPACTVPGMVPQFWPSVVRAESHLVPTALHDDTVNRPFGKSYYPATEDEAEDIARRLMAAGHRVGVGLSQLTASSEPKFIRRFGTTLRAALNPCLNMKIGASFYVTGALSIFNTGSPVRGFENGYIGKIVASYTNVAGGNSTIDPLTVPSQLPRPSRSIVPFTEDEPVADTPLHFTGE